LIALSACTTMGAGTGSVSPGDAPVKFSWKSTDGGTSGTMSATLADGQTFSGPYLEGTSQARTQNWDPFWAEWQRGIDDWDPFPFATTTLYSGRVMATLQDPTGQRMRCQFELNAPAAGMPGGGQGTCKLKSGRSVDAVFPAV
jgi:hypothetical protein